jgi:cytochrome P450
MTANDNPLHVLLPLEARRNPYPALDDLRESSPLVTSDGTMIVGRYRDCLNVLRDPAMGNDTLGSPELIDLVPGSRQQVVDSILFMDGADHRRLRGLISKAFTPRITAKYEPWIQGIVDELLGGVIDQGSFDVVRDFANVLAVRVILELLDLPRADLAMLKDWSDDLALATELPTLGAAFRRADLLSAEDMNRIARTSVAIHAYFADLLYKRRKNPGEDLVSSLLLTEDHGQKLARNEVTDVLIGLFAAAHESVTNLISSGVLALHRHPDQLRVFRADPALGPSLVEEVMRYDAPLQLLSRVALSPTTVGGLEAPAGTVVILLLAAANRDEAEYPKADRFIVDRQPKSQQLGFGAGPHFCIGSSLARLEAQIALRAVTERFSEFEVDEDSLVYRRHVVVRGLQNMTVRFQPRVREAPHVR